MLYLWRAVDQEGEVLENYITKTRDKGAALRSMKKTLKRRGPLDAITTALSNQPHRLNGTGRNAGTRHPTELPFIPYQAVRLRDRFAISA